MPDNYQPSPRRTRFSLRYFVLVGFCFGLIFPMGAITLDLLLHDLPVSLISVIQIHTLNPIHFIVDSAPLVLSGTAYIIGRMVQYQEHTVRRYIVDSEKRLHHVIHHNPDAIFLVRTNDQIIEQCNRMALQLCGIDSLNKLDTYAPSFFCSLNKSLSILAELTSSGDTFSTEATLTTAKGNIIWGQVSLYTFSLHEHNYQLIRITDITPIKQRELELEKIRQQLQESSEELQMANEEIIAINNNLEQIVEERTELLHQRNEQLAQYAFLNAHTIRGPLARILGAAYVLENAKSAEDHQTFTHFVTESAKELDTVIHRMSKTLNVTADQQQEEVVNVIEKLPTKHQERLQGPSAE
ncbi:MAG: PAS domain-containing protein [Bacteroidota bacterium]